MATAFYTWRNFKENKAALLLVYKATRAYLKQNIAYLVFPLLGFGQIVFGHNEILS